MLVLSRKRNEAIVIGDATVVIIDIRGDRVRLGVEAPKETPVYRREVYEAIKRAESAGEPGGADGSEPEVAGG